MSRSINKATLLGNVGTEPEIKSVNGTKLAKFSLATSREWTDGSGAKQEKTEWHHCTVWNSKSGHGLADVVEKHVKKGDKLYIEGVIEYSSTGEGAAKKHFTAINVKELVMLAAKAARSDPAKAPEAHGNTAATEQAKSAPPAPATSAPQALDEEDEDFPF